MEKDKEIAESRFFTLIWGLILVAGSMIFENTTAPVVVLGLRIASFTYGGMLGVFILGIFFPKASQKDAMIGFVMGIACTGLVLKYTTIAFTWHGLIGCAVTLAAAGISRVWRGGEPKSA